MVRESSELRVAEAWTVSGIVYVGIMYVGDLCVWGGIRLWRGNMCVVLGWVVGMDGGSRTRVGEA